ncbi:unnamed protein product [Arctia plantaginis]|uniref:Uncharacterized protein n=1 Tax=Arctia plantaginis TaxID=874455 RepID=A0A8S1A8S7_ARCPL|nr:unnamed protein product [Arctia plantaginis]
MGAVKPHLGPWRRPPPPETMGPRSQGGPPSSETLGRETPQGRQEEDTTPEKKPFSVKPRSRSRVYGAPPDWTGFPFGGFLEKINVQPKTNESPQPKLASGKRFQGKSAVGKKGKTRGAIVRFLPTLPFSLVEGAGGKRASLLGRKTGGSAEAAGE